MLISPKSVVDLAEIDNKMTSLISEVKEIVQASNFEEKFTFKLDETNNYSGINELNWGGIYLIEIKTESTNSSIDWIEEFCNEWQKPEYVRCFVPNIKKKRTRFHFDNVVQEWFPLYIGKSRNISRRIKEHLDLKLTQPTTSLKLRERKNMYGHEFRVSTIKIETVNYDIIAPQFESVMRDKINPILGRQ